MKCLFDIELDKNFIRFDIAIENCFVDRGIDERSSERSGCISKCLIYLLALRRLIWSDVLSIGDSFIFGFEQEIFFFISLC